MIFYLATYPRSGNSLLRQILERNFGYLCSKIGGRNPAATSRLAETWGLRPAPERVGGATDGTIWNAFTATYDRYPLPGGPVGQRAPRRFVLPLGRAHLTDDFRRSLAAEREYFFIKTHELPTAEYFPGEHVIQLVRHPGPTLRSYFCYIRDSLDARPKLAARIPPPTLTNVVAGRVTFGSWSAYHDAWTDAGDMLGDRFLRLRFEDIRTDLAAALGSLSLLTCLPHGEASAPDFETYAQRHAERRLGGRNEGYESFFSTSQLALLWSTHAATATRFGYEPPRFESAGREDQIERLEALVELAWARASHTGAS